MICHAFCRLIKAAASAAGGAEKAAIGGGASAFSGDFPGNSAGFLTWGFLEFVPEQNWNISI
jgi:hypothetical protein